LFLSAIATLTHPVLDYMNSYGLRWLMPFSGHWFYGDALFIVDPWIWLMLAGGLVVARRRAMRAPSSAEGTAQLALALTAAYVMLMLTSSVVGRRIVWREVAARGLAMPQQLMVGPVPVNPFVRDVVLDYPDRYVRGQLEWLPSPRLTLDERALPKNASLLARAAATSTREGRAFLRWARFPFFVVEHRSRTVMVRMDDARYSSGESPSFASMTVWLAGGGETSGP
jgi:inner membrane protein